MHQQVISLRKETNGLLDGYIVIHETKFGPALGGTRIAPYKNSEAALADAKRLAIMMSKKTAVANLPFGGGKGVINGDPGRIRTQDHLKAYAKVVDGLGGKFYTGEDVGLTEADVQFMLTVSPYFIGKTGLAGDPSGYAAESTFLCLKEALRTVFHTEKLGGVRCAIKGVGKTGLALLRHIASEGGDITIADTNNEALASITNEFPTVKVVPVETIHAIPADVFSPCALGDDITLQNVGDVAARIICGTANNQLAVPALGAALFKRGVVHVPDFIANAGGVINVADELMPGGYNANRVKLQISKLPLVLREVWDVALQQNIDLDSAAEQKIESKIFATI